MGTLRAPLIRILALLSTTLLFEQVSGQQIDLTSANRRPPIAGLPDWSTVGFEKGQRALPTDADVGRTVTADELASSFGVIANDGVDDTDALQNAISSVGGSDGAYTLIQLPAGVINLSHTIYLDSNYIILRGASNDPDTGTQLVFSPDDNTKYDKLSADGSQWDLDAMSYSWSYDDPTNPDCGSAACKITGSSTSGWLWPGRSIFRVGTRAIADKFQTPYDMAPANRKDFFLGSVNYHWHMDIGKQKGYLASQDVLKPGIQGATRVYINDSTTLGLYNAAGSAWVGSPTKANDYTAWGVEHSDYYVNSYVFQDWHTVVSTGTDDTGPYVEFDRPLRFDIYANSVADGSAEMENTITFAKVMPPQSVHHIGIENLYMTQPMAGFDPSEAVHNYGNLAPESAMHGIVFRMAEHSWVRGIRTFMTGSHPIATEDARYIQIQDNYFDGAWNKGAGGNGYLRGSRVWESLYFNNTLRNLRHITMQWCSMGNVVIMNNITNDMNLHGGYEGFNLFELNYASIAYEHRAGSCTANCGGEGGSTEGGTWWPIYWSTGDKASKWSGASGPQNVFYRNYMLKAPTPGSDQVEYQPYFARDGSLSDIIWQFGWDRDTVNGDHYQHLTEGPLVGPGLLLDWQGHEQEDFADDPNHGVNGLRTDKYTSLFLRDVTNATGVPSFSSIAGFANCRGQVVPKVVGYYLASSASNACMQTTPDAIDTSSYTHILYGFAVLGTDGTVTLSSDQQDNLLVMQGRTTGDDFGLYLAVGGWGLGTDPTALQKVAVNTGGARTKMANSLASLLTADSFDGVDLEWAPGITAAQFTTIVTTIKTAIGSKGISISVPNDFWSLSGVNKVTETLRTTVDFITIMTHSSQSGGSLVYPNGIDTISSIVTTAQQAGMFPDLLLMPIPFYGRTYQLATAGDCDGEGCSVTGPGSTSTCIASGGIGQNTYSYYSLDSIVNDGDYEGSELMDDTWIDADEFYQVLTLADGSVVEFDNPISVVNKVGSAIDLCMGGVSVFSIEQDSLENDLTNAIWDVGALAPTAEDIVASFGGSSLTGDGYIDESYWDQATNALATDYPWLPATSAYRVLVAIALKAEQDLANRLRNYLQFSELTDDNFALYQKWQGKAVNWALANITGYGRQYWTCSSAEHDTYEPDICPHQFDQDDQDEAFADVWWQLTDHDGFANLVNETLGLNISTLLTGDIDVPFPSVYCIGVGNPKVKVKGPNVSSANSTSLANSTSPGPVKRQHVDPGPDPYDPDPNCKSTWHGVFQVNASALFQNPTDTLNTWIQSHDAAVTVASTWGDSPDASTYSLTSLLEYILTSISIGNNTVQSMEQYIAQVRYDEQLQKEFDAYQAQNSGLHIFLDIFLGIIGLIPGIGDGGLLIDAAVNAANAIGDGLKIARVTESAEDLADFSRVIDLGAQSTEEAIQTGKEIDSILDAKSLDTRGKLGTKFDKNNDAIIQCIQSGAEILMDATNLAEPLFDSDASGGAARRRSWEPEALPKQNVPYAFDDFLSSDRVFDEFDLDDEDTFAKFSNGTLIHYLDKRKGGNKAGCIFQMKSASQLKGNNYAQWCKASTNTMTWNTNYDESGSWVTGTYSDCKNVKTKGFRKGGCGCDHILEANEVLSAIVPDGLSAADRAQLCSDYPNLTTDIKAALNGKDNMEGLWHTSNTDKANLVSPKSWRDQDHIKVSALTDAAKTMQVKIATDHLTAYASRRQSVAQAIDAALAKADKSVGSPSAAWKSLYTAGMMDTARTTNDKDYLRKMADAKSLNKASAQTNSGKRTANSAGLSSACTNNKKVKTGKP